MLGTLVDELRPRHAALAVMSVRSDGREVLLDPGVDNVSEETLFEIGSITKTITATLLAELALAGRVALESTVGDVLGDAGDAAAITLVELATHTSGLSRLPPNFAPADPRDPYAGFGVEALMDALKAVTPAPGGPVEYSNFGFQLLGHLVATIEGRSFEDLAADLLRRAGCARPRVGDHHDGDDRIPGYDGTEVTPRWRQPLGGAGAVELGAGDLARWLEVNCFPDRSELSDAVRLAQAVHWGDAREGRGLAWRRYNGGIMHNGGTAGFRSFCAFVPDRVGVGVLTNQGRWQAIDNAAIMWLTRAVRS